VLAGEEANDKAARAFIGGSKEAVEGAMLAGDPTVGMLSAGRTLTSVDGWPAPLAGQALHLDHRILPPFGQVAKGPTLILFTHC
jgi:hypothetical protein